MICQEELGEKQQRAALRAQLKDRSLSSEQKDKAAAELQRWCEKNPDLKPATFSKITQGGDKHRLTLTTFQVVEGWFDPSAEPKGFMPPSVLIVPCAKHCRLEDIGPDGKWLRRVEFTCDEELVVHEVGKSAGSLLLSWRRVRDNSEDLGKDPNTPPPLLAPCVFTTLLGPCSQTLLFHKKCKTRGRAVGNANAFANTVPYRTLPRAWRPVEHTTQIPHARKYRAI